MDGDLPFPGDLFQAPHTRFDAPETPSRYRSPVQVRAGVPPDATLLLLARHAQSEFNAEKRFCGRSEVGLSALGRLQAHALAQRLGGLVDRVYSSTQGRAIETARAFDEPQQLPGIEELDQGELEGLTFGDAFSRYPDFFAQWRKDPESVREPLGETLGELRRRVLASIDELVSFKTSAGKNLLVVGHQLAWASLLAHLRQVPPAKWNAHTLPNARFARAWFSNGDWFCDRGPEAFDAGLPGPASID